MATITPLRTLDRTSPTLKAECDAFFGSELRTFSLEAEAARVEVVGKAATAATSAATATTQAGTATDQAVISTTQAGIAIASANTAVNAPGTQATSATSMTVGTGVKAFTLAQTGKAFAVGQWVSVADSATPSTNWMLGAITAFTPATGAITVNVTLAAGSLTGTSWAVVGSAPSTATTTVAVLAAAQKFTAAQRGWFVSLTDAATVAVDLSLANQFTLVLGGNRTLGVPTNVVAGQQGVINVWQDVAGGRTLAYSWLWGWAGGFIGTVVATACVKTMLSYSVDYYDAGTFTVTIGAPAVFTKAGHGYISGQRCQLSTTGALPTGLATATTYYVRVNDANTFLLSTSVANAVAGVYIATTGAQSGTHTIICGAITLALSGGTP